MEEFSKAFIIFDRDADGTVSMDELKLVRLILLIISLVSKKKSFFFFENAIGIKISLSLSLSLGTVMLNSVSHVLLLLCVTWCSIGLVMLSISTNAERRELVAFS